MAGTGKHLREPSMHHLAGFAYTPVIAEGRTDHRAGAYRSDNPYPRGSYARDHWRAGWDLEDFYANKHPTGKT